MTILQKPPQCGDTGAWFKFGEADEAELRHTEAWEHETFAEEQARWERSDPEYAQICEEVRRAKQQGEEASRRADQAKAEWDVRVARQRQAHDEAQRARHASEADYTARRQTASSRVLALRHQLDLQTRVEDRTEDDPDGALAHRLLDGTAPRFTTTVAGHGPRPRRN